MHGFHIAAAILLPIAGPALAESKVLPGQWQSTMIVEEMQMPGIPPEVAAMVKGRPTTVTYCLTPEEARSNPEKMMTQDDCTVVRFGFEGGAIDAAFTCKTDMGPATMTMAGSYTPESYDIRAQTVVGSMSTRSRMSAKRLGPCKAGTPGQ